MYVHTVNPQMIMELINSYKISCAKFLKTVITKEGNFFIDEQEYEQINSVLASP